MGDRIREHRIKAGLSQDALAELVGVSRQAVTKWESGASSPTAANLFKLAEIFGTTVDLLMDKEKDEENKIPESEKDGRKISLSVTAAALTAAVYIAAYLAVQFCTAYFSESSLLSVITHPSHSPYLWSWLLTNRLFWCIMAVSVFSALCGKFRFSAVNTAMFFFATALGEILGPYPAGAPYGPQSLRLGNMVRIVSAFDSHGPFGRKAENRRSSPLVSQKPYVAADFGLYMHRRGNFHFAGKTVFLKLQKNKPIGLVFYCLRISFISSV